jgi:peptide/nickel transport system substrate-binding protein
VRRYAAILAAAVLALWAGTAAAQSALRIGLAEDPDILDPTLGRTFVGRIVFAAVCDKLFDLDDRLGIVPQLATAYEWGDGNRSLLIRLRDGVTFHDGEKFDAEAVRFNLDRHKTLPGSTRRTELTNITGVEVVDKLTVKLTLSAPFAPLLSILADRSGMMVSPKAAREAGANFGAKPVCAGPYRFVERVAQDRIVVERFADYWNKAAIQIDRIVYLPIVDSTVRLANLRAGQLDFIERLGPSDVAGLKGDSRFKVARIVEIGYQGITINVGKSEQAQKNPLGRDARVREAFELSLERDAIVQVAMDGEAQAGNQWVSPQHPFYVRTHPMPKRDIARARALLKEAGATNPSFTLLTPTTSDAQRLAQVVQAMAQEAGFDVKIQSTEFATSFTYADKGQYEAYVLAWSGRADPDGNFQQFYTCGSPNNYAGFCSPEMDKLIQASRTEPDLAKRKAIFAQMVAIAAKERPIIYLYHRKWLWAHSAKLAGLRPVPDGLVRVQGLRMN